MTTQRCEPALAGFLAAIMVNPDGPERFIMADFLEERADPRAAILREPGGWRRRPKEFNSHRQALVWRPLTNATSRHDPTRCAIFNYTAPFPRCIHHIWCVNGNWERGRAGDRAHGGKWLCTPCYNLARRTEDFCGISATKREEDERC